MTGKRFGHEPDQIIGIPAYLNTVTGEFTEHPTPEQAAQADAVVCMLDEEQDDPHADDVHEACRDCGRMIHHRPDVPAGLPAICIWCAYAARLRELAD